MMKVRLATLSILVLTLLAAEGLTVPAESQMRQRKRLRTGTEIQIEGTVQSARLRRVKGYNPKKVKAFRIRVTGSRRARLFSALVCQSTCSPLVGSVLQEGALRKGNSVVVNGRRQGRGVVYVESLVSASQGGGGSDSSSGAPRMLYLATLRPDADADTSSASGFATIRLSQDNKNVLIAFDYNGLTSPRIAMHVHDTLTGGILIDLDEITPDSEGIYEWDLEPTPQYTVEDIVRLLNSGQTYINIHTANYPAGEIEGTFVRQGLAG